MKQRNQKLHLALEARRQFQAGEINAEQALTRLVWGLLEPMERKALGYAVQTGSVTASDVAARFGISITHASTVLKLLYDHELLTRTDVIDDCGRAYVYAPAEGVDDVG